MCGMPEYAPAQHSIVVIRWLTGLETGCAEGSEKKYESLRQIGVQGERVLRGWRSGPSRLLWSLS